MEDKNSDIKKNLKVLGSPPGPGISKLSNQLSGFCLKLFLIFFRQTKKTTDACRLKFSNHNYRWKDCFKFNATLKELEEQTKYKEPAWRTKNKTLSDARVSDKVDFYWPLKRSRYQFHVSAGISPTLFGWKGWKFLNPTIFANPSKVGSQSRRPLMKANLTCSTRTRRRKAKKILLIGRSTSHRIHPQLFQVLSRATGEHSIR